MKDCFRSSSQRILLLSTAFFLSQVTMVGRLAWVGLTLLPKSSFSTAAGQTKIGTCTVCTSYLPLRPMFLFENTSCTQMQGMEPNVDRSCE